MIDLLGTEMVIWKQGQFYPELGKEVIKLPYLVNPGPSDQQIMIEGFNVSTDSNGNFLECDYSDDELDAIHTYGTIRLVIDLYEELLGKRILWSWQQAGENVPLRIRIRNNDINARFLLEKKCLEMDFYGTSDNLTYNCRTVDLLAHETGHAIFNSIFPEWRNGNSETRGMEEAFCDLSAMFFILSRRDLCKDLIQGTKGDLTKSNFLTLFGVGHGPENNFYREIRNAMNKKKYKENQWSPYYYCEVLVGILYDIFLDLYKNFEMATDESEKLFEVGKIWSGAILKTFLQCSAKDSTILEFSSILEAVIPDNQEIIKKHFNNRKVY